MCVLSEFVEGYFFVNHGGYCVDHILDCTTHYCHSQVHSFFKVMQILYRRGLSIAKGLEQNLLPTGLALLTDREPFAENS
jgi:hypothetical protein